MAPILCSVERRLTTRGLTFRCAVVASLLLLGSPSIEAQPAVRQVLVLQSFDRGNMTIDQFTANFRVELDRLAGSPVNLVQVVVGATGLVEAPDQAIVDYIQSTFADRSKPDLILAIAGPAAVFARKHRQALFPGTPILFAAVDRRILDAAPLGEGEAATAVANDFPGMIDDILQLLPQTKQVFMVMGSGELGAFWHQELAEQFKRFQGRLTFIWSNDLSLPEILRRCASLPRNSAILYFTFGTDASGAAYADERVLADIHATASAPMFGVQSSYVGYGVVGGSLVSIDDVARNSADAAIRILNGAPPESIAVPTQLAGRPVYDWRELDKWGIAEIRLPSGSVVRFRGATLWREYRTTVLGAIGALLVQSLLIGALLYQRRARQRAEIDSRRNLALAADANRRQTMSTLTSSIAHEVGQPLSAMIHNAQALQMLVTADQATPETTAEILSDIRTQGLRATQIIDRHRTMLRSHQVDKRPIELHAVINESLALVAHDLRARQIEASVNLSSGNCVINGDQVLLQQVLVNLAMNAMDAMDATAPARRRIAISTEIKAANVAISVRDTGTGLPAHLDGTLFTPFVTTKTKGLGIGLTIARTIVEGHGGSIEAHNNSEGGATFTVTLPCGTTRAVAGE
jgi:signal transduction histidine kinase